MSPYPVPQNFDWSGFVNVPYAAPASQKGITHVRQHTYRGYQRPVEKYQTVFKEFNQKKEAVYNLIRKNKYISDKTKNDLTKYLNSFYTIINDEQKIKSVFIKNARK